MFLQLHVAHPITSTIVVVGGLLHFPGQSVMGLCRMAVISTCILDILTFLPIQPGIRAFYFRRKSPPMLTE